MNIIIISDLQAVGWEKSHTLGGDSLSVAFDVGS